MNSTVSKCDLEYLLRCLENYAYYVREFPEIVDDIDEDDLMVCLQMVQEKLDETK